MSIDKKSMMQKKFVNPLLSLRTELLFTICLRIPCKIPFVSDPLQQVFQNRGFLEFGPAFSYSKRDIYSKRE